MKITNIETILLALPIITGQDVPLRGGVPTTSVEMPLVRVDTDAGISGWGEAFPPRVALATQSIIDTVLRPFCVGRDAGDITGLHDALERALLSSGRNGPARFAMSAVDIALWDIAGKAAGMPLYRLLGGGRTDLPAYASLPRYGKPAAVRRYTEQALARGYRYIKVHEVAMGPIEAARAAAPGVPLMVDANCPWTVPEAVDMARRLQPLGLHWLEEPVWPPENLDGLAEVRRVGGIPIAAGENYGTAWEFRRAFQAGALTYAQPSVTKIGGVTEMRKVIALAEAFGVTLAPHSPYFGPGLLAAIHCAAAIPAETLVERYYLDFAENPLGAAIDPQNGRLAIPQGPGLGLDPDPGIVAKYRVG